MLYQIKAEVIENREVALKVYKMLLYAPLISEKAEPGQFLHIRVDNNLDPLLRRPISIHGVNRKNGKVSLLYQVAGTGTLRLSEKKPGQFLDVMGPIGKGFTIKTAVEDNLAVIAGGIGIAPLYFLLQELKASQGRVLVFLGARSGSGLLKEKEITEMGYGLEIATDDGSRGYHGPVTDLFEKSLNNNDIDFVYSCGPPAMLKKVSLILKKHGIPGEVSLEERMACGVGACLSCVCKIKDPLSADGYTYQRACTEGPVFPASEVLFE